MWWWHDGWSAFGPWMLFGPVMMLIFIALCIALVFFFVRGAPAQGDRAVGILKERFARGEIDLAEFEERRRAILG